VTPSVLGASSDSDTNAGTGRDTHSTMNAHTVSVLCTATNMSQATVLPRRRDGERQEEYVARSCYVYIANINAAQGDPEAWERMTARWNEAPRAGAGLEEDDDVASDDDYIRMPPTINTPCVFTVREDGEITIDLPAPTDTSSAATDFATEKAGSKYIKARKRNVLPNDDELENEPKDLRSGTVVRYWQTALSYSQARLDEDSCSHRQGIGNPEVPSLLDRRGHLGFAHPDPTDHRVELHHPLGSWGFGLV
jgi:hypothetical protein